MLGAWTGLVLLFLYAPIGVMVAYSFNDSRLNLQWTHITAPIDGLAVQRALTRTAAMARAQARPCASKQGMEHA